MTTQSLGDGDVIAREWKRQSGSRQAGKDLECGSFREWEIVASIKPNLSIRLTHINPNI